MLNVAAPGKFVLTLQSIPPFLIENILVFALAVLLAVPLIARLQLLFANHDSYVKSPNSIDTRPRRSHRRNPHITIRYSVSTLTTSQSSQSLQLNLMRVSNSFCDVKQSEENLNFVPITDQSQDQHEEMTGKEIEHEEEEEEEEEEGGDNYKMSDDNPIMNIANLEYKIYRDKLIKENLKKNYGHFQAPGNFILNAIHLNSINSQKGLKFNEKYNNNSFLNVGKPSDVKDEKFDSRQLEYIDPRDYFLTKKSNEKLETIDRGIETRIDQSSELINTKERVNTPTGSPRKLRPQLLRRTKSPNDNDNDHAIKDKIKSEEINSRSNSSGRYIRKLLNRPLTPRSQPEPKESTETEILIDFNCSPVVDSVKKSSDSPGQMKIQLNELKNTSYIVEVPAVAAIEKNERAPSHASSIIDKCSSMTSSEVFSTCSSKNPERRLINTRPGSSCGGGASKPFKNLMAKVKSRPRSSGASFAWEVPEVPRKVPSYEKPPETKIIISNTKRPRSANTTVNRKKSEVLSVLESIMDLSCDTTNDFQESTIDMDIKHFREMSDDIELTKDIVNNICDQVDGNFPNVSASMRKTKLPVSLSNQKRTKTSSKSIIENKEIKPFLRARSGNYSHLTTSYKNRKKEL